MTKLKQILSLNNSAFSLVANVEPNLPNVVCFAAQNRQETTLNGEATWILIKLTLTKDGNNCQFELSLKNDDKMLSQIIMDTILSLISK